MCSIVPPFLLGRAHTIVVSPIADLALVIFTPNPGYPGSPQGFIFVQLVLTINDLHIVVTFVDPFLPRHLLCVVVCGDHAEHKSAQPKCEGQAERRSLHQHEQRNQRRSRPPQ